MEENYRKMPSVGGHLTLMIFSFIFGVLWGLLSISPFNRMKAAVNEGDYDTATANARKIKIFFFVGLAINVLFIVISVMLNNQ